MDLHDVDPKIQVGPELALLHPILKAGVGREDEANVDRHFPFRANGPDSLVLQNAQQLALKRQWQLADLIWTETGDTSTDWNHYSKRTILSGVITSTVLAWIASEDISTVEAFLDNRIQNVMQFEKLKAGVSKRFGGRFSR